MKPRIPNLVWLGLALAVAYWLTESLLHTFVFDSGPLAVTMLAAHDPNELWMRVLISAMFVAFGFVADRSIQAERRQQENARRVSGFLRFLDYIMVKVHHRLEEQSPLTHPDRSLQPSGATAGGAAGAALRIEDLGLSDKDIATLVRFLQEISSFLDVRFKELHALLELTHEINMGMLLDEVLEKSYEMLRSIIPYDRLGVALIDEDGQTARARWARSDNPEMMLRTGYSGSLKESSLQGIIASGEPRIINDLAAYLETHPHSEATRLIVAEGIRASLTCPLISAGRPIGFMFFSSRTADTYKSAHVEIFKLIAGHLSIVVEKSTLYQQVLQEKEKSEHLLLNVMPARIAARLRTGERSVVENLPEIGILFADIEAFTGFASRFPPKLVLDLLEDVFARLDGLCDRYGIEKIKTIGDEYMAISVPSASASGKHLQKLAGFALEILAAVGEMRYPDGQPVRVRIGMHAGPVIAGVLGQKKFAYDIWGDTVNVASRMESSGETGRIHVTQEIRSRLQNEYSFEERDTIEIRGKGPMKTYFLKAKPQEKAGTGPG